MQWEYRTISLRTGGFLGGEVNVLSPPRALPVVQGGKNGKGGGGGTSYIDCSGEGNRRPIRITRYMGYTTQCGERGGITYIVSLGADGSTC